MNAITETLAPDDARAIEAPPALGQPWRGGIYAGVVRGEGAPDYYLIVGAEEIDDIDWSDAMQWAKGLRTAGYDDWDLPNRRDGRVLWANVRDVFADDWYWLNEQSAGGSSFAWYQGFVDGSQDDAHKSNRFRRRAVRRLPIQ